MTELVKVVEFDPLRTVAMVCGPEAMMRFAAKAFGDRGLPEERVYVSLERNMSCAIGLCGHCQLGPLLLCRDGPVVGYDVARPLLEIEEL